MSYKGFIQVLLVIELLISTTGIGGGHEQTLISRNRQKNQTKFPEYPVPNFFDPQKPILGGPSQKGILGAPSNPMSSAKEVRHAWMDQDGAKDDTAKAELPGKKMMADAGLAPSSTHVILELRIPTSLGSIQESHMGPLSSFLDSVQNELCKSGKLSHDRLQLLGIRGEYVRVPMNESNAQDLAKSFGNVHGDLRLHSMSNMEAMADQHVIVELEILPGNTRTLQPTAESIFTSWKSQLASSGSQLLQGPLGAVLKGSSMRRPPVSMSSRALFNNAFKSSAVPYDSLSWAFSLFCVFWWVA